MKIKKIQMIMLLFFIVITNFFVGFRKGNLELVEAGDEGFKKVDACTTIQDIYFSYPSKIVNSTCFHETVNYAGNIEYYSSESGLTARDALAILKQVVGIEEIMQRADADLNGIVDAEDALYVLKCVVELEEPLVIAPKAYDIYQFEMIEAGTMFYEPSDVKDFWKVIKSVEELQEFIETDLENYFPPIENLNKEQKENVSKHFSSLNEEFFEENVYVVTLNGTEPYATTYSMECLEYMDNEEGQVSGVRVRMILGSGDDDVAYPTMEIINVFGGVVIPREDLLELDILDVVIN